MNVAGVAVVTDSTAYLPTSLAKEAGIAVVPLHVIVDDVEHTEGVDITPAQLVSAMRHSTRVSTSRPSPATFLAVYESLAAAGATGIVSVHLSGELSGTYDAAHLAAPHSPVPVVPVDSSTMGMALGHAALSAAASARAGADASVVAEVAAARAAMAHVLFYVNSLDHLRRGGRIGAASAFLGSALAIKPLLALSDGHIEPVEKLRTSGRALGRLLDLACEAIDAGEGLSDVVVHHLDATDRAEHLLGSLIDRAGSRLGGGMPLLVEMGGVAGVHLGPGAIAVSVSPRGHLPVWDES